MAASFGTFFELGGRGSLEALGNTGLDYVIIDLEHGPFSDESAADYILAAENCGIEPYVRIRGTQRPYVLRMLDVGARGLIVPYIRTLDQIYELIDVAKFPPLGHRGFCPTRTSGWGTQEWANDVEGYMQEANKRAKIIPQCETKEALDLIDEIASTEGVDGIFAGPLDLSINLGIPLQLDHPQLTDAINRILEACKTHGKKSFIYAGTMEEALKWARLGFDRITYSLDAKVLIDSYQKKVEEFHKGL